MRRIAESTIRFIFMWYNAKVTATILWFIAIWWHITWVIRLSVPCSYRAHLTSTTEHSITHALCWFMMSRPRKGRPQLWLSLDRAKNVAGLECRIWHIMFFSMAQEPTIFTRDIKSRSVGLCDRCCCVSKLSLRVFSNYIYNCLYSTGMIQI